MKNTLLLLAVLILIPVLYFGAGASYACQSPSDTGIVQVRDSSRTKSGKYSSRSAQPKDTTKTKEKKSVLPQTATDYLNNPLFVIDGVPHDKMPEEINSDDINSVSILKGEKAVSIYGERGKNGVIVVTTKKYDDSNKAKNKKKANNTGMKKKRRKK